MGTPPNENANHRRGRSDRGSAPFTTAWSARITVRVSREAAPLAAVGRGGLHDAVSAHEEILVEMLGELSRLRVAEEDRRAERERALGRDRERRLHLAGALGARERETAWKIGDRESIAPRRARRDV